MADIRLGIPTMVPPPVLRSTTDMEALMRLDSHADSGLTDTELTAILAKLVKCQCGLLMLRRVFDSHRCMRGQSPMVIDLTADDDTDTEMEV